MKGCEETTRAALLKTTKLTKTTKKMAFFVVFVVFALVIFTNENGGEWLSRNAPLYHRKGTLWEGGIRARGSSHWNSTTEDAENRRRNPVHAQDSPSASSAVDGARPARESPTHFD